MSWNHRVFRDVQGTLSIREAYYENDEVTGWTRGPEAPVAYLDDNEDTIISLRWQLTKMLESLEKPVIDEEKHLEMLRDKP